MLKTLSTKTDDQQIWTQVNGRFYRETIIWHLVFDQGIHSGKGVEYGDPEPHLRAIKLNTFQGVVYRKTKTGEVMVGED